MQDEQMFSDTGGGESYNLAMLAGINLDDVEAIRRITYPVGFYRFRCTKAHLTVGKMKGRDAPSIQFELVIRDVIELADPELQATSEKYVGKKYTERFTVYDNALETIGQSKAFMLDTGYGASGALQEVLASYVDHEFVGFMMHKPDKDDKDKIYANIDRDRLKKCQERFGPEAQAA